MKILRGVLAIILLLAIPEATQAQSAIVTFTFDDVPKSVATVAFPLMQKYQYPGTVFVETRNTDSNYPGYMNWKDVDMVAKAGWEIGAHTYTHPHLTQLSDAEILDDLFTSTQDFASHGYSPVDFASPFGDMNDHVLSIIMRHYQSHRTAFPDGINTLPPDPYRILQYDITQNTTLVEVSSLLDGLQSRGGWLVFQMHAIAPKGVAVQEKYNTDLLEDIVELVHAKGLPVRTVKEALAQFQ